MSDQLDKATEQAKNLIFAEVQKLETEEDVALFAQQLCILSSQMINGLRGKQFHTEFLTGAIQDPTSITVHACSAKH